MGGDHGRRCVRNTLRNGLVVWATTISVFLPNVCYLPNVCSIFSIKRLEVVYIWPWFHGKTSIRFCCTMFLKHTPDRFLHNAVLKSFVSNWLSRGAIKTPSDNFQYWAHDNNSSELTSNKQTGIQHEAVYKETLQIRKIAGANKKILTVHPGSPAPAY